MLTGRRVSADEALRIGLVGEIAKGSARERAAEIAAEICNNGPLAVRAAKRAIDGAADRTMRDGLQLEFECYQTILSTSDRVEALKAFAEKRKPVFKGR